MTVFRLFVPGVPIPQGSKTAGVARNGKAYVRDANKRLKPWRAELTTAIEQHRMLTDTAPVATACVVQYEFLMPRPASARRKYMTVKPDLDKLIRAVNDAAVEAQLLADDALVISLNTNKRYAVPELDETPGVHIQVWAVTE